MSQSLIAGAPPPPPTLHVSLETLVRTQTSGDGAGVAARRGGCDGGGGGVQR